MMDFLTILYCVLIADFITGFFHWFEDTYITLDWPTLGETVGEDNITHHVKPHIVCYCVLTNWLNPILDATRFWRGLEFIIHHVLRVKVKRGTAERRGL